MAYQDDISECWDVCNRKLMMRKHRCRIKCRPLQVRAIEESVQLRLSGMKRLNMSDNKIGADLKGVKIINSDYGKPVARDRYIFPEFKRGEKNVKSIKFSIKKYSVDELLPKTAAGSTAFYLVVPTQISAILYKWYINVRSPADSDRGTESVSLCFIVHTKCTCFTVALWWNCCIRWRHFCTLHC